MNEAQRAWAQSKVGTIYRHPLEKEPGVVVSFREGSNGRGCWFRRSVGVDVYRQYPNELRPKERALKKEGLIRYYVLIKRPVSGVQETYMQDAEGPITAIIQTMDEFKARNNMKLPVENVIEVGIHKTNREVRDDAEADHQPLH